MGLDIRYFRKVKLVKKAVRDEDGEINRDKFVEIDQSIMDFTEKNWPGRSRPLVVGVYSFAEQDGFAAGSYGGYNVWRNQLSLCMRGVSAEELWKIEDDTGPFAELIHFADNEGIIGPAVSEKLARDFANGMVKAFAYAKEHDQSWFLARYRDWKLCFETAADGGLVELH